MKGMSLDVSFDSVLIHQTLRRHLYDKGKPNIKSVRARYQDCFLGGRNFPPTRLFCSERLPLYTFLSFKVCTKFPKGKGIIVRITKMKVRGCWRFVICKVQMLELCQATVVTMPQYSFLSVFRMLSLSMSLFFF